MMKTIMIPVLLSMMIAVQGQEPENLTGTIQVRVDGLSCPFCAYGLEKKLTKMSVVTEIEVDVENARVTLILKENASVTREEIRKQVKDAGFTAREIRKVEDG